MRVTRHLPAWTGVAFTLLCACGPMEAAEPLAASAAATVSYEAESAALTGGAAASQYSGYSGTGYATFSGGSSSAVEWTVTVDAAATYPVVIRFANGSGSSYTAKASANGGSATSFSLSTTGGWTSWTSKTVNLRLNAGTNRIRLAAGTTRGLPNVDKLDVTTQGGASTYTLTVAVVGAGTTSPAAGTYTYPAGATVSLTATPASGSVFQGWSGSASGTSTTTSVVMSGNRSVTATFVPQATSYTLTVGVVGAGSTSPSAGTYTWAAGTTVTLTASPAAGWAFQGWSGSASGTSLTTSVVMNGTRSVTATFVPQPTSYTLTIGVVGNGTTNPPPGTYTYASGAAASISASPGAGATFQGWSGDATGTSPTTSIAMTQNRTVTATFTGGPVATGAIGFANDGTPITGGAAGPTVYVASAAELEQYSDVDAPYTIYITRSFPLSGMETHVRSNKTVIGVGNVTLSGGGLYLYRASNVIIRNLTIVGSTEDNIGIHYSDHIWIDHCTLADSTDGNIDITQGSDYITISWSKFHYTANNGHNFVSLIASSDSDDGSQYHVTYHHNWWGTGCVERMPSVRFGRVHVFNNYYNTPGNNYAVRTRVGAEVRVENNFFENVRNPWEQYVTGSGTQGKLFAAGNNVPFLGTANGVTWTGTTTGSDGTQRVMVPGTDAVFAVPYPYTLDPAANVRSLVMAGAGAGAGPFAP